MKKLGSLALCAALLATASAPAMARSVGVDVDGKTYVFHEDGESEGRARWEIDGKTFLIGADEVIVREDGKPDRHLTLTEEASADAVTTAGTGEAAEFVSETSVAVAEEEVAAGDWVAEDAAEYAAYAPYGLSYDVATGKLYYMGEPVRAFEDIYAVDGGAAELSYFDGDGSVDVRTARDDSGELIGLEALSEEEFAERDLSKWTNPAPASVEAIAGDEPTPGERAAFFATYAPFGLRYDAAKGALYLSGRPVRNFLDVRASNGENPIGGKFQGTMTQLRFEGEVDVTILRNYAQSDENGEGKIIGVEVMEVKE